MNSKLKFLIIILAFAQSIFYSQAVTGPVNSFAYALVKDKSISPALLMNEGVRAFRPDNKNELENILAGIEKYISTDSAFIFILTNDSLIKASEYLLTNNKRIYTFHNLPWPTRQEIKSANQNIIILNIKSNIQEIKSLSTRFNGSSDYILWKCPTKLPDFESLYNYWNNNAQAINFFECSYGQLNAVLRIINELNKVNRISGCFMSEGRLIDGVSINSSDQYLKNKQFCFPFNEFIKIKTQKNSYDLTPQYILAHYSTDYVYSVINATRIPIERGRILHLKPSGKNDLTGIDNSSFRNNAVKMKKDASLSFHHFEDNAFYTFSTEKFSDSLLNMTISTRFRITKQATYHSIICQGFNFILKIHRGFLGLTIPTKNDYILYNKPIELNKWYNLAITITEGSKLKVYLDGILTNRTQINPICSGNEFFMIGNSPFQEQFQGDIRNLQIWNRGLDDEDIAGLYSEQKSNTLWITGLIILLLPIVFVTIFLFLRKRKKAFRNSVLKVEKTTVLQAPKPEVLQSSLLLFGEFALYNSSGENLAAQMSPKTKQLFLLVILKTLLDDGVSTRELNDMLWPGMNDAAAKNNRGVTVLNLRQALSASQGLTLDYAEKRWMICGHEKYFIDFQTFRNQRALFSESNHNLSLLNDLLNIISKPFLQNLQAEWLDLYKNTINEDHLDWLMHIAEMPQLTEQPEILLKIASAMFAIDEVNENALQIRINAYRKKGNEAMVRKSVESFKKKYVLFYNEEYSNTLI